MRGRLLAGHVAAPGEPASPRYPNRWPVRHILAGSRLLLHYCTLFTKGVPGPTMAHWGYYPSPYPTSHPSIAHLNLV